MRLAFKRQLLGHAVLLLGALSTLAGCANLNTIDRATPLDSPDGMGKAVHLDIQQRLLIVNAMDMYCAEPSPDALAAFAAAAGIGASAPAKGAVSASGSAGSSAASIGLRTQSITLMRDALYRMCEAYGNNMLSRPQVMTLLSRSQDLTAVVLATEQLTGAVVAQQAALSGSATADATAVMTATTRLLEAALKQQERAQARVEQALERKADAQDRQNQVQDELTAAQAESSNNPGNDTAGQRARARLQKAEHARDAANRQVILAEEILALRERTLESATERVESLQLAQETAATSAAASSSSGAVLSGGGDQNRLNAQSTEAIATAVSGMVNNVLNKSYVLDSCLAMISSNGDIETGRVLEADRSLCRDIVRDAMTVEKYRVTGTVDTFDKSGLRITNCIKSWLDADEANMGKLDQWRNQKGGGIDHVTFMFGSSAASLRSVAVKDLSISCE